MPNVTIRNLPADAHAVLTRRARAAGQSLQQYLRQLLIDQAETMTMSEWVARNRERLSRAENRNPLKDIDVAALIREERDAREAEIMRRIDHSE